MILWTLTYDTGDYYCEGKHLAGVFPTADAATAAMEEHRQMMADRRADKRVPTGYTYSMAEIEVGKVYDDE